MHTFVVKKTIALFSAKVIPSVDQNIDFSVFCKQKMLENKLKLDQRKTLKEHM